MVTSGVTDIAPQKLAQPTPVPLVSHDIGSGRPITVFRADPTNPYGRVAAETVSTGGTFYSIGKEGDLGIYFKSPQEAQAYAALRGQVGAVVGQSYAASPTGAITPVSSEQYWAQKTAREEAAKAAYGGVRTETALAPKGAVLDVQKAVSSGAVPGYVLETPKGKEYFLTEQATNIRAMQLSPKPGEPGYHATAERPLGLYQPTPQPIPQPRPSVPLFDPVTGRPNIRFEGAAPAPEFIRDAKYGLMIRQDLAAPRLPTELRPQVTAPVSEFVTYPIYMKASEISKGAASWIEGATGYTRDSSVFTKLAVGMAEGITSMPEYGAAALVGGEAVVRTPKQVVPLAGAGLVTTTGGIKTGLEEKPVETIGSIISPAILGKVGSRVSISERIPSIGIGKPKGILIEVGEAPISTKTGIVKPSMSWKEFQAAKGLKGVVSPERPKLVTPIGSERLAPRTTIYPSTVAAVSGWQAYAGKPTTKETIVTERELMGTPEGTLGDITFERTIKQPVAKVYIRPPEAAVGDIMNRITGQIEYVKTPEGSFMKIKPAGVSESVSSDISRLSRQISGAPTRAAIGETPKPPSTLSLPSLSRYIRLERKLPIEPTTISRTVIPSRPALPEVTWDIEMGKESPRPGKPTEYDIYGGRVTGKGMQPTEPLVSGIPERLQLAPREVSEFDVGLSMLRKERAAVKPEVSITKPTPSEQATIDLAESVRTSLEEPISTYEAPTVTRPSVTMKAEPQLKTRVKLAEAPTTEFKIEPQPLMTKEEQQAIAAMGISGVPVGAVTPRYTKTAPQIGDISITAKYYGINPADVNLFRYSDMTFIEPTGSLQPYPTGLPRPTPDYYPTPYPRYAPTPYPTPDIYPEPYPTYAPAPAPRPSPYPEPYTGYPDIWGGIGISEPPPKVKFFEDEKKKRKAKPRKKEAYTLGFRATPLISPLASIKEAGLEKLFSVSSIKYKKKKSRR